MCFVKAYNRSYTTLNVGLNLTRDLNNFFIKQKLEYKYGTIYRSVIDTPPINWCYFMNGTTQNIFFKVCVDIVQESVPQLIHPCPYKGEMKGFNMSFDALKFGAVYPRGEYRSLWQMLDDKDSNIYTVIFETIVKSPILSSFG